MSINLQVLATGILAILFVDTAGSIFSRKYKIDYTYLSFVSLLVYFLVGYFGARLGNLSFALFCCALVGFFDATIGWDISTKLFAYTKKKQTPKNSSQKNIVIVFVTILSLVIGAVGCMFGNPS